MRTDPRDAGHRPGPVDRDHIGRDGPSESDGPAKPDHAAGTRASRPGELDHLDSRARQSPMVFEVGEEGEEKLPRGGNRRFGLDSHRWSAAASPTAAPTLLKRVPVPR